LIGEVRGEDWSTVGAGNEPWRAVEAGEVAQPRNSERERRNRLSGHLTTRGCSWRGPRWQRAGGRVHRRGGARSSARVAVHGSSGRDGARVWQRKAGEAAAQLIKAGAGHGRAEQAGERGAAGLRGRARSIGPKPGSRLGMTGRGPRVSGPARISINNRFSFPDQRVRNYEFIPTGITSIGGLELKI
jgi:hypothetical protein